MYERLFIIGNGFDSAHGLPTKYKDFRRWICKELYGTIKQTKNELDNVFSLNIPDVSYDRHMEPHINYYENKKFLMWLFLNNKKLVKKDWHNFEDALPFLDINSVFDSNKIIVDLSSYDKNGMINLNWKEENYNEKANDLLVCTEEIKNVFSEWINSIEITNLKKRKCITSKKEKSLFINFNYTETLEKIYGIPSRDVFHLHGFRISAVEYWKDKQIEDYEIVVGHGGRERETFYEKYYEVNNTLNKALDRLRKPVNEIISKNSELWDILRKSEIQEIYSFGFGFGKIDEPYIEKICNIINENCIWYLNDYDNEKEIKKKEKIIRKSGFKGKISIYNSSEKIN